jgi:ankyrin repeat protein
MTPLLFAADADSLAVCNALLDAGADISAVSTVVLLSKKS